MVAFLAITFLVLISLTSFAVALPAQASAPRKGSEASVSSISTTSTTATPVFSKVIPSLMSHLMPKKMPDFSKQLTGVNPYRFTFASAAALSQPKKHIPNTLAQSTVPTKTTSVSSTTTTTTEKNWLLTKAWLIDNINRLRREMSELERDYSQHLDAAEKANEAKERQFLEDITKLRADHTVLSQQQKQIIYLVKKVSKAKGTKSSTSENDIRSSIYQKSPAVMEQQSNRISNNQRRSALVKRAIGENGDRFQATTTQNMVEVFSELSALHDLTLTLFTDMREMEHRLAIREKFQ